MEVGMECWTRIQHGVLLPRSPKFKSSDTASCFVFRFDFPLLLTFIFNDSWIWHKKIGKTGLEVRQRSYKM